MSQYEENYFKTLNYSNYLERKQKYFRTAFEIVDLLNKLTLINKDTKILDFGCFESGTKILTSELVYKNIEEITTDDYVVTHLGNSKKVTNLMTRYKEKIIEIDCGYGIVLRVTEEHPILVKKKKDVICKKCKKTTCNTNLDYTCSICGDKKNYTPKFIEVKDVEVGDFFAILKKKFTNKLEIEYENNLAEFLGFYLAEGSILYSHRNTKKGDLIAGLNFCFNKSEKKYIERIEYLSKNLGATSSTSFLREEKGTYEINVFGKELAENIFKLGGKGSLTKKINLIEVDKWSETSIKLLISSWLKGDGWVHNYKNNGVSLYGTTISESLFQNIVYLLNKLGICPGISKRKYKKKNMRYDVSISGVDILKLDNKKNINCEYSSKKRYREDENYIYVPVRKITEINKRTKVYNFEVEEDNSYIANGVCVHNCAVGFLMAGLRELGYKNIVGCDVSDWARKYGQENFGNTIYSSIDEVVDKIDLMFALDVFEHMEDEEILNILEKIKFPNLIVRIPSSVDGETFHLDVSRRDPTHINCKTKGDWISFFEKIGYKNAIKLNLFSIYDSEGVSCFLLLR